MSPRRVCTAALVVLLGLSAVPAAATDVPTALEGAPPEVGVEPAFEDVTPDHVFFQDIQWVGQSGISRGTATSTGKVFGPGTVLSRQAMAAFFFRYGNDPNYVAPSEPAFADVPVDHVFYREIMWTVANGLTHGYPDGSFRPDAPVTREAAAAFLHRLQGGSVDPTTPRFTDVGPDHLFFLEIEWMAGQDISTGYPDGTFRPATYMTREAMAAFLFRYEEGHV
jgi:hypothetical protein